MRQRRVHYEQAFEKYLRQQGVSYVAVDEAHRAQAQEAAGVMPAPGAGTGAGAGGPGAADSAAAAAAMDNHHPLHDHCAHDCPGAEATLSGAGGVQTLKNFDFLVYAPSGPNLLVDVKGRKHAGRRGRMLDNWVTESDVSSMRTWRRYFGPGFRAVFAFLYWCDHQPPDALFLELFEYRRRWYAMLAIDIDDYVAHMRPRSGRWGTVNMPAEAYHRLSRPFHELWRPERSDVPIGSQPLGRSYPGA